MLVRILKYWKYPDILRQTPGSTGVWNGINFVIDEPGRCDYAIIHGRLEEPTWVRCPKGHIWLVMGEAPHELAESWHKIWGNIDRAYMTDERKVSEKHILSYSFSPWWVDKDYDYLTSCPPCEKTKALSWVTSNKSEFSGHRYRLKFLEKIRMLDELDLYGRGHAPISGKWEALAPYRYSIAFENYSNSHYWSEKVMDCFLAWTMPIYYGCTQLDQFFPRGSYIQLDPEMSDPVAFLREVINSDLRERNIDAIREARHRVLNDYNLFNVIAHEIAVIEEKYSKNRPKALPRLILNHTTGRSQIFPTWMRPACHALKLLTTKGK